MGEVDIPAESQARLLSIARGALEDCVLKCSRPLENIHDPYLTTCDYGAFVSLYKRRELRGCVGTCAPETPLYQTVVAMTQAAASRDSRMMPVTAGELSAIRIDISVLTRLALARDPLLLQVGKHGLHIACGGRRGVLLPQVATRYGWDIETFLGETCLKAGLAASAWRRPGVSVSSFSALVFEEPL